MLVALAALGIDQGTKLLALDTLSETERIPLLGDALGLQLAFNAGTVLSLGSGSTWLFTLLGLVAMVVLAIASTRATTPFVAVGIGVLWGGAAGNLADRLLAPPGFGIGHVTDFLAYGTLFIGNLADVLIGIGVGLLAIAAFRHDRAARRAAETAPPQHS